MITSGTSDIENIFTTFILGVVMSSLMTTPTIIAMGYAYAWQRALNPGKQR